MKKVFIGLATTLSFCLGLVNATNFNSEESATAATKSLIYTDVVENSYPEIQWIGEQGKFLITINAYTNGDVNLIGYLTQPAYYMGGMGIVRFDNDDYFYESLYNDWNLSVGEGFIDNKHITNLDLPYSGVNFNSFYVAATQIFNITLKPKRDFEISEVEIGGYCGYGTTTFKFSSCGETMRMPTKAWTKDELDINGDGVVDGRDASKILKYYALNSISKEEVDVSGFMQYEY